MGEDAGTGREKNREIPKTLTVVCIIHGPKNNLYEQNYIYLPITLFDLLIIVF